MYNTKKSYKFKYCKPNKTSKNKIWLIRDIGGHSVTGLKRRSQSSYIVMKRVSQVDQSESQASRFELEGRRYTPEPSAHDHDMDVNGGDLSAHTVYQTSKRCCEAECTTHSITRQEMCLCRYGTNAPQTINSIVWIQSRCDHRHMIGSQLLSESTGWVRNRQKYWWNTCSRSLIAVLTSCNFKVVGKLRKKGGKSFIFPWLRASSVRSTWPEVSSFLTAAASDVFRWITGSMNISCIDNCVHTWNTAAVCSRPHDVMTQMLSSVRSKTVGNSTP